MSLYVLPAPRTSLALPLDGPSRQVVDPSGQFLCDIRTVEGWKLARVQLNVPKEKADAAAVPLDILPGMLREMLVAASSIFGSDIMEHRAYILVHVAELRPPARSARRWLPWLKSHAPVQTTAAHEESIRVVARDLLDLFDPLSPGSPRGYFHQYDEVLQRKGFLAIGPRCSVLLGLSDRSFTILALTLQSGDTTPTGELTASGLQAVINRAALWTTSQDVRESTDYVTALRRTGDISTRGQIRISYTLALIGIALAFLPLALHPLILTPGLISLGVSGLFYARYTQQAGGRIAGALGFLTLWLGMLLLLFGFGLSLISSRLPFALP